jgi:ribosomal protein L1
MDFTEEALLENIRSFMVAVTDSKPEGRSIYLSINYINNNAILSLLYYLVGLKGKYILAVHLSSTMGPGIPVEVS